MPSVPAGDESGLYYIIIGNLSFKSSWQSLKDFARNCQSDGTCINIEHAHIYPNTGDGWVTIRGKSDFRRALKQLNGGVLDGRALIADGRNETQAINLRDAGPTHQRSESLSTTAPHYYAHQTSAVPNSPASTTCDDVNLPHICVSSTDGLNKWSYCQQSPPSYASTYSPASPTSSLYDSNSQYFSSAPHGPQSFYYAGNVSAPLFVIQSPQPIYPVPFTYATSPPTTLQSRSSIAASPPSNHDGLVQTEARKVIITHINPANSESEVRELVIWAFSSRSWKIEAFEYPRHPDGKPKGYALVVLDSHETARRVVNALEGMKWGEKTLGARFAKEGAEPNPGGRGDESLAGMMEQVSMSSSEHSGSRKERYNKSKEGEKKYEKKKEKGKGKNNRGNGESSSHRMEAPVVDGTGGKR